MSFQLVGLSNLSLPGIWEHLLKVGSTIFAIGVLGTLFCQLHCLLLQLVHENCEAGQVVKVFKISWMVAPPGVEPGTKT